MTDTRPVPMEVHHHLQDTNCVMTCIILSGAQITVVQDRRLDSEQEDDLLAVLAGFGPLMARLCAAPDVSGPMVLDLHRDTT